MQQELSFTSDFIPHDACADSAEFTEVEEVYSGAYNVLVRAKRNGKWWILKALKPEVRNELVYQQLLRKEFDILSSLCNPGIVEAAGMETVNGWGECIVMEWIDGQNLRLWLKEGHSRKERRRVLDELLNAVEYMHKHQVVHRDLKPENIMVTRNGHHVKLVDFGLADTDSYTVFKQPAGTTGYISPEQQSGCSTDGCNDIYSLGRIVAFLHLGRAYDALSKRCARPLTKRPQTVADVRLFLKRRRSLRKAFYFIAVLALIAAATWGPYRHYYKLHAPNIQETAQFCVDDVEYTAWGGPEVSARLNHFTKQEVVIPATVSNKGADYDISEIGFNCFKNDSVMTKTVITCNVKTMHILKGAFKNCPNLRSIYIDYNLLVGIGTETWPCSIEDIFDDRHFNEVTLYVHREVLPLYQGSEWRKFKHIKTF